MGIILEKLKSFVFTRRNEEFPNFRGDPTHPERNSPDTICQNTEHQSTTAATTTEEAVVRSHGCSKLYLACRYNRIDEVQELLKMITLDEIDQMEPNGSTALHAACYHGHVEIVKLLLEAGADRAIPNKYNCLPFDEALTEEIKELFLRVHNSNRLVAYTGAIEWELIDDDVLDKASEERHMIKSLYDTSPKKDHNNTMFNRILKNYINNGLAQINGIEIVRRFFEKAAKEQNPQYILKAYTAETDFYKILNRETAGGAGQFQSERRYIIALLLHHPALNKYAYNGSVYRAMRITLDDVQKYKAGCRLMTKSFVSSSIDRKITELFACQEELAQKDKGISTRAKANGTLIKSWAICIYKIKHQRNCLHIENISQYASEGEVLIMPFTVFEVQKVSYVKSSFLPDNQSTVEIELEECDLG